jgi:dihydroorotate dehydrogenase
MSPILLKRSGIGPEAELREHGITVVHHSPQVGENLMDHMELYIQQECTQPITLLPNVSLLGKAKIGVEWLLTHKGLGATNHFETGGHIRSRAGIVYPDIQFHFLPLAISYDGKSAVRGHGYQVHVGTKRSKSRGWVRLRDARPQSLPRVQFNYMTHPDDWLDYRACVRLTREIFAQTAMAPYRGAELAPGADVTSDEALDALLGALQTRRESLRQTHGRQVPMFLKIAPDLDESQIQVIAATLQRHGIDGVIATNTTLSREAVAGHAHAAEAGGLSGAPVLEASNRVIRTLRQALGAGYPIIGVGGVMSGADARAKLDAGADLVQLYTGFIYGGPPLVTEAARAMAATQR